MNTTTGPWRAAQPICTHLVRPTDTMFASRRRDLRSVGRRDSKVTVIGMGQRGMSYSQSFAPAL
jgi:hypothetical protein